MQDGGCRRVLSCADSYRKIPDEACLIASTSSGETIAFQCSLFDDTASLCRDKTNFNYVPAAVGSNAQLTTSGFASSFVLTVRNALLKERRLLWHPRRLLLHVSFPSTGL